MSQLLVGRMAIKSHHLRPGQGAGIEVRQDQVLQIITLQGHQVADFVAYNLDDTAERLSTGHTRGINGSLMLTQGMKLYSNRRNPMFELIEDTVGRHDILFAACDPRRYADDFGAEGHANCRDAIVGALGRYGITNDDVPDPVNWFMNIGIVDRGALEPRESLAEKNDYVMLRALMHCVVAVTACPQDKTPINNQNPTDILVRVFK